MYTFYIDFTTGSQLVHSATPETLKDVWKEVQLKYSSKSTFEHFTLEGVEDDLYLDGYDEIEAYVNAPEQVLPSVEDNLGVIDKGALLRLVDDYATARCEYLRGVYEGKSSKEKQAFEDKADRILEQIKNIRS